MSLRVLHVHAGTAWGGVETAIETVARTAPAGTHAIALGWDGPVAHRLQRTLPVHLAAPARLARPWSLRTTRAALEYVIAHVGPHVCLLHSTWALSVWGPAVADAGVPLVLWHHGMPPAGVLGWLARQQIVRRHLANSGWTAEGVRARWPGADPAVVYPPHPAHAPSDGTDLRAALGAARGDVVLATAARWEPGKGHDVLLRAVARLDRAAPWQLWLAGAPTGRAERRLEASARRAVAASGLADRVRFLGQRDDVPALLAQADIYVQANVEPESFGLTFVEAMAAGRPVVTSDLGAAREVVADAGLLVPPGDPDALAAALTSLATNAGERTRRGSLGPARAASLADPVGTVGRLTALLRSAADATLPAR